MALLIMLVVAGLCVAAKVAWARRRVVPPKTVIPLVHSINDDRCTGCDACVTVCPTDVLELVGNKSRVARMDDCIQCEQCALVCPTTALVMHPRGTVAPSLRMPILDAFYQASPGLYLIGEASGKPLLKNASNLGRAVVEHMVAGGLSRGAARQGHSLLESVDVVIVGSGPAGLSAALTAAEHGLRFVVLEKDALVASTIARWPVDKECMAEPYDVAVRGLLPVWDAGRDALLARWHQILAEREIVVRTEESVEEIWRNHEEGGFEVRTNRGQLRAARVVLAVGTRGKPRRLGVPGEHLAHVRPLLTDPTEHRGQRVLVVGGGDSAVEAAISLAEAGARPILSYRGRALSRCKAKNRQRLERLTEDDRVELRFSTTVTCIEADKAHLTTATTAERVWCDAVLVCIGGDAPVKWLSQVGVQFGDEPHAFVRPNTDVLVDQLLANRPSRRKLRARV